MKHIKNISELKASTYRSAASELRKKGHFNRVDKLNAWAKERGRIDSINQTKDIGVFEIKVMEGYNRETTDVACEGQFYISIGFDEGRNQEDFKYLMQDGNEGDVAHLVLDISILPLDMENDKRLDEFLYVYNGKYYMGSLYLPIGVWDGQRIVGPAPIESLDIEPSEYRMFFKDRRNANKFRKSIINILKGNVDHNVTRDNPGGTKEMVMDFLMSSDVDYIDFDDFQDFLSRLGRMNVNYLYKD